MRFICEYCGREHNGSYGSGRFCSQSCARGYATTSNKSKYVTSHCVICGVQILVNKHTNKSLHMCDMCKDTISHNIDEVSKSQIRCCSICGRMYTKSDGGCKNDFCKHHRLAELRTLIKYFTFDEHKLKTQYVEQEYERVKSLLYYIYHDEKKSFSEISKIFGYQGNPGNLTKVFRKLGIPVRSNSESVRLSILNGNRDLPNCHRHKSGWHTSWNGKEVYLRSSYEKNYAEYLDKQHIDYDVECFRIKYYDTQQDRYRCAIPDFYLPKTNTIVEIKSSWTLDEQNMKDKFVSYIEQGYDCMCICDGVQIEIN